MRVRDLTRTEKSLVAIARALSVQADVLVLDEPSASLPADEVHRLFDALRPLKARGVGMIYVSHRLDEVFEIADRIAVLRDGALVGERRVADTTPEELVSLIVGKALDKFEAAPRPRSEKTRLAVAGLTVAGAGPVDFAVAQSEIVGLVGLRGAGQERIGRALFGALPAFGERSCSTAPTPALGSPAAAMQRGDRTDRARPRRRIGGQRPDDPRERLHQPERDRPRLRFAALAARGGRAGARDRRSRSAFVRTTRSCRSNRCRAATSKR